MKSIILCNGTPPSDGLLKRTLAWADLFIAADGGGNTARRRGVIPDVVIGDLDSFQPREGDAFEVIEDTGQETNDLEKALEYARNNDIAEMVVLGATGERLDQTLKNLSVLKQFNDHFEHLVFSDDFGETRLLPKSFEDTFPKGTLVSLFPLSGSVTGITTQGLKFALENETLENGVRDGSSNEVVGSPVRISHERGDLIMFVGK